MAAKYCTRFSLQTVDENTVDEYSGVPELHSGAPVYSRYSLNRTLASKELLFGYVESDSIVELSAFALNVVPSTNMVRPNI